MSNYTVTITNDDALTQVATAAGMTAQDWLQAEVTELENGCVTQLPGLKVKAIAAKYAAIAEMDETDLAAVDAAIASHTAKVSASQVVEGELKQG